MSDGKYHFKFPFLLSAPLPKICRYFCTFWKSLGKTNAFLDQKQCFLGVVYIAYYTELNLRICNYAQKRHICRENIEHAADENFMDIFALAESLPTSATLV